MSFFKGTCTKYCVGVCGRFYVVFLLYLSPSLSFPSRLSSVCTLSHSDIISLNKFDWLDRLFQHISYYIINMSIMIKFQTLNVSEAYIQCHCPKNTFCISHTKLCLFENVKMHKVLAGEGLV